MRLADRGKYVQKVKSGTSLRNILLPSSFPLNLYYSSRLRFVREGGLGNPSPWFGRGPIGPVVLSQS